MRTCTPCLAWMWHGLAKRLGCGALSGMINVIDLRSHCLSMRRLIPAWVEDDSWEKLAGAFQIDMEVKVRVYRVRRRPAHLCV